MKIRIKDWNVFEKDTGSRVPRNINISNIADCYGVVCIKKKIYYIIVTDFYLHKCIDLIKLSSNLEIIDNSFNNNLCFATDKTYCYYDVDERLKVSYKYDWIFAEKWMVEHDNFFVFLIYLRVKAIEIFEENHKIENLY